MNVRRPHIRGSTNQDADLASAMGFSKPSLKVEASSTFLPLPFSSRPHRST